MFKTLLCASLATFASATQVALVVSPNLVPSNASLYTVDTETSAAKHISSMLDGSKVYVSGAAVCDGVYYAVWTDIPFFGLASVDMETGEYNSDLSVTGLWHSVWCGPSGTLLGVQSAPQPPFSLVSYDIATQVTTKIATFPTSDPGAGTDTIFSYNEKAGEVWGQFSTRVKLQNIDKLGVMSLKGNYTEYVYNNDGLTTFAAFPQGEAAGEGITFPGIMSYSGTISGDLKKASHTIKDSKVTTKLEGDASDYYTEGSSYAQCQDGMVYGIYEDQTLFSFDGTSLKDDVKIFLPHAVSFPDNGVAGGATCV